MPDTTISALQNPAENTETGPEDPHTVDSGKIDKLDNGDVDDRPVLQRLHQGSGLCAVFPYGCSAHLMDVCVHEEFIWKSCVSVCVKKNQLFDTISTRMDHSYTNRSVMSSEPGGRFFPRLL